MNEQTPAPIVVWATDLPAAYSRDPGPIPASGARDGQASLDRCAVAGCGSVVAGRGLCHLHHRRSQAGQPLVADHEMVGHRPSGHGVFGQVMRTATGVQCHECGRWFRMLVQHLRQAHDLTVAEYRARHGLAAQTPLTCLDTSEKIALTSQSRVGTPGWDRLVTARDSGGRDRAVAAAAAKTLAAGVAPGAAAALAAGSRNRARLKTSRKCTYCRGPVPTGDANRYRSTCSRECALAAKKRAANRRAANQAGEPFDCTLNPGTGAKLPLDVVAQRVGTTAQGWRSRVAKKAAPRHDGRTEAEPWWWESTIAPYQTTRLPDRSTAPRIYS